MRLVELLLFLVVVEFVVDLLEVVLGQLQHHILRNQLPLLYEVGEVVVGGHRHG